MLAKVVLVATLLTTIVAVTDVLRRDELDARTAARYLLLFTLLFLLRVVGQIVVALRAPRWLPPMEQWNLLPYRLLLPIQLGFLAVMASIVYAVAIDAAPSSASTFGRFLIGLSVVYAGAMAVRYVVRMRRRPDQRWFGGAIPIVFHLVLAAFLLAWGRYYVSG
jgi:hypothetical protein